MLSSNRTKDAFVLSERGYMKLVKAMDDDDSWDIMDKFVDEYFRMREVIKKQSFCCRCSHAQSGEIRNS